MSFYIFIYKHKWRHGGRQHKLVLDYSSYFVSGLQTQVTSSPSSGSVGSSFNI